LPQTPGGVVTVTATSVASVLSTGTSTVTVQSDVAVSVAANPAPPVAGKVDIGFTQQFAATVTSPGGGSPDTTVTWSISGSGCGGGACGTITQSGLYTAPRILPNPNAVSVTATSVADPSKSGSASISIDNRFSFSVSGPSNVDNGTTAQFSATVTPAPGSNSNPSPSVNWLAPSGPAGGCTGVGTGQNQCGTIDATGLYTAPVIAPANPTVFINAQSVADPSKGASPSLTINAVIIVSISPKTPNVEIESTQVFNATVGGSLNQSVIWDVNGVVGGNSLVGTITNPGTGPATYTGPQTIPGVPITVTATSVSSPGTSAGTGVTIFSTISAGLQPSGSTRAINRHQTLFGSLTRTSTGNPPANNAVTWTVNGVPGGSAAFGFMCAVGVTCDNGGIHPAPISATGVGSPGGDVDYIAPASVPGGGPVTIVMQSQADTSKSASSQVTIVPNITVSVSPTSITLPPTLTQQFTANVVGTPNTSVTWDVNGVANGDTTVGQICQVGVTACTAPTSQNSTTVEYRSPGTPPTPPNVTVKATSVDDPTQTSSGSVTISTGPFIQKLLPASITSLSSSGTSFTLKVQGINFVASSPGPGSVIEFTPPGTGAKQLTTTCSTTTECTATIAVADVAAAGQAAVQIQNPGTVNSNSVNLVVLDPATEQKDFASASVITLSTTSPSKGCNTPPLPSDPGCQNITVVEPTTAGSGGAQVNIGAIGFFTPGLCSGGGTPISIARPASGSQNFDICLFASGSGSLPSTFTYTISGPTPNDITLSGVQAVGNAVRFTLGVPSTAQTGPRTIFVETPNREKSALVGAIEVK
jgi:hypothetical protein